MHVSAHLIGTQYRDTGLFEIDSYGPVKCDRRSCTRHFSIPLRLYRYNCDVASGLLIKELERLEEKPDALIVFDRVFDNANGKPRPLGRGGGHIMYLDDVICGA